LIDSTIPANQISQKEVQLIHYYEQDRENLKALPTANLIRLTFNINRGKDQPPLTDIDNYLPYAGRWKEKKSLTLVNDFSKVACQEILNNWEDLDSFFKAMLLDFKIGMERKIHL